MFYTVDEILNNTSGYIFYKSPNFDPSVNYYISGIENYMQLYENTIFIPIKCSINYVLTDSFVMIENYIKRGIRAIFFDEIRFADKVYYTKLMSIIEKYKDKLDLVIMVADTMEAIYNLANYTRMVKLPKSIKYIAVTGSVGKTATTEMLYSVLSQKFKVYRGTPGVNIKIRIAHKFFETDPDIDFLLFECSGMGKGYLKYFSELLMPDYAIITKIAQHCLGIYRTIENVAEEKITLLSAMSSDSLAILNSEYLKNIASDYPCHKKFIDDGSYELLTSDTNGSKFIYNNETYFIPLVGQHQIDNAVKVIELSKVLGLNTDEINSGFLHYQSIGNRWVAESFSGGIDFVLDNPNNPYDAILANIKTFISLYKDKYKKIIITKLNELGNLDRTIYLSLAKFLVDLDFQELICIGEEIKLIADYVSEHTNIKVIHFKRPEKLDENDAFVKYLLSDLDYEQAILFKGVSHDEDIVYSDLKSILERYLKKVD